MNATTPIVALLQMAGLIATPLVAMLLLAGVTAVKNRRRTTPGRPFIPAQRTGGERR